MKLAVIAAASRPLQKLIHQDLPLRTAYDLAMIVTELNPHLQFYGEMLTAGRDQTELDSMEVDVQIFRIQIPLTSSVVLSAADVKNLENFVEFTEA